MTPQDPSESNGPLPESELPNCTLSRIAREGPDALPPDPAERILAVKLCKARFAARNALNEATTYEADNLFQSPAFRAARTIPAPAGEELTSVTLEFLFADTEHLNRAHISPPNQLQIERPSTARRIASWLFKNHLLLSPLATISQFLTAMALALLAAVAPVLDGGPDDTDDDDDHNHVISASR